MSFVLLPTASPRRTLGLAAILFLVVACTGDAQDDGNGDDQGAGAGTSSTAGAGGAGGAPGTSSASSTGAGGEGDPWAGPLEALAEVDLGDIPLLVNRNFTIPDRTLGFTLQGTAPSPDEVIGIARLRAPVGGSVIFNFAMAGHTTQVFGNYGWVGGANPQSDSVAAVPVQQGTWQLGLGDDDGSISGAHVRLWVRRTSDGAFHGGVVDVNVFIASGSGASPAYMSQVLDAMFPYLDLDLGSVAFFTLPSSYDAVSSYSEYRQLLQSSTGAGAAPALNLFVIGAFTGSEFPGVLGVAGGIPGSPMRHGTGQSGVAYVPQDPAYDASILRHEVGHLAGLFHTTEFALQETDPLSDTAECPWQTIQSTPDGCPDVTNAMFPVAYGATAFTQAQRTVVHGSALYRGVLTEGGPPAPPLSVAPPPAGADLPVPWTDAALPAGAAYRLGFASAGAAYHLGSAPLIPLSSTDPLERVLGAVWCDHAGDYEPLAIRVAAASGDALARLRAIALDPKAPPLIRGRALGAYLRAAFALAASPPAFAPAKDDRPRALAAAAALAKDEGASRFVRVSALRALSRTDPKFARNIARELAAAGRDTVVRDVAQEGARSP